MTQNIYSYIIKGLLHWYRWILSLVGISTEARKLASFDIPTPGNIHRYQCNNPILNSSYYNYSNLYQISYLPPWQCDCLSDNWSWSTLSVYCHHDNANTYLTTEVCQLCRLTVNMTMGIFIRQQMLANFVGWLSPLQCKCLSDNRSWSTLCVNCRHDKAKTEIGQKLIYLWNTDIAI